MKKAIQKRWYNALKSSKYKQTTGMLKDSDGHCCLGVLTDLYLKEKKKGWNTQLKDFNDDVCPVAIQTVLPLIVQKWAGLDSTDPSVQIDADIAGPKPLSTCNDALHLNFEQIAELIKQL